MIKNFFKVAIRSLWKQKGYSFLNIFGLAIGMACSLLILLWIRDEEAVDNFHAMGDRLYSVYERQYYDGKIESGHYTPGLLPEEMKKSLPAVEMSSGFDGGERMTFQVGEKILKEDGAFAGADFFRMFSYPLLEGNAGSALSAPVSMAISRKMAVAFLAAPRPPSGRPSGMKTSAISKFRRSSRICRPLLPISSILSSTGTPISKTMTGQKTGGIMGPVLLSYCGKTPIPRGSITRSPISS